MYLFNPYEHTTKNINQDGVFVTVIGKRLLSPGVSHVSTLILNNCARLPIPKSTPTKAEQICELQLPERLSPRSDHKPHSPSMMPLRVKPSTTETRVSAQKPTFCPNQPHLNPASSHALQGGHPGLRLGLKFTKAIPLQH